MAFALGFVLLQFTPLPFGVALALAATPAAAAGIYAEAVEKRIKRREENYAAFVRSLGASAAARGGSMRDVLRKLIAHNFGPLTRLVQRLYARLTWRLHDMLAWKHFCAESGSSRDQKQPCPDDDGPGDSRDALTGRCETFDGDGCRHDSHRAKVHDPDDQEDRHQTGAAAAAVEA